MDLGLIQKIFHTPVDSVKQTFKDAKEIGVKSIALIGGEKILFIQIFMKLLIMEEKLI